VASKADSGGRLQVGGTGIWGVGVVVVLGGTGKYLWRKFCKEEKTIIENTIWENRMNKLGRFVRRDTVHKSPKRKRIEVL